MLLVVSVGGLLWAMPSSAADIYVAQSAQGADTGTDAANAHSVAWFNNSANWGRASTQIGPGCTVHLCGTVTNSITFQTGGSVGNPITLLFEPNAKFSAPTWSGNIITAAANITIDGDVNGVIEATANGTGLTYQNWCVGVCAESTSNLRIQNLTIRNMYVRTAGGDHSDNGIGIVDTPSVAPFGYTNLVVTNCILHDMLMGISVNYGSGGCTNIYIRNNSISNINWGIQCGDVSDYSVLDGLYIQNNIIGSFGVWDNPITNSYHHNGAYGWTTYGNSKFYHATVSGNMVFGFGAYNTSGFFFSGGGPGAAYGMIGPIYVYNNIFNDPIGSPANGDIVFGPNAGFLGVVANNDFFGNGPSVGLDWTALGTNNQNVLFFNNVVSNSLALAIFIKPVPDDWSSDYNDLASPSSGGSGGAWFSVSPDSNAGYQTLAAWRSYGYDQHSITVAPGFSTGFIPSSGSLLVGAGTNLSGYFTTDYAGNPRPSTGKWTIGAFEPATIAPSLLSPPGQLKAIAPGQ